MAPFWNDHGETIDDAIVFLLRRTIIWWWSTPAWAPPSPTICSRTSTGGTLTVSDLSDRLGKMDIQGPAAAKRPRPGPGRS
jgi:glycine cleavage system aminomethyltransferase T